MTPPRPFISLERPSRPIAILGVYFVVFCAVVLLVPGREAPWPLVFDTIYMPFRITTAIMLGLAARASTDPVISRAWWLLTAGQVFAVAGNSTWIVSDITGQDTENWTYLAWTLPQNILTLTGFWWMMRSRDARIGRRGDWVDAAVLVVACATIAWYFISARLVATGYDDAVGVFLFFFDSTSNDAILLFAATVWLRSPRGVARGAMPRTVAGLLLLLAGDLVIESQLVRGTYASGSLLDIWYAAAVFCLALGADAQYRDPSGATAPTPNPDRADALVFGALAASLIPLIVEIATTNIVSNSFAASGLGVVVLMLLVLWRQRLARSEIGLLIANRLQLEQQLWQAQKLDAVGRLAGGIAHDFNNILAVISSHAQLLRVRLEAGGTTTPEAAEIEFATERAAVLVRRLLTFSSATSPDRKPVVLGEVVASMQPILRQLPVAGVTLEAEIADDRAIVRLADGQLEQVLLNLAINARDATPSGGQITVSTSRVNVQPRGPLHRRGIAPGAWAVLSVRDTGAGMDVATRASLFQPFFTTKSSAGGTGLGLATVAGIVHAADGHILVESATGRGTTMTVYLPLAADSEPAAATRRHSPASGVHAGTILVVDDELPIRTAIARYLSRLGYRVIEASDAAQALSQMEQHDWRVDLVLTDVRMPHTSGPEMVDQLRAKRPNLPVLFMSGHIDASLRSGASGRLPRADMIDKPFDLEVLAERIRQKLAPSLRTRGDVLLS